MKISILILFTFYCVQAVAQKKIEQLIQAEKDFAAYSVANNTRAAFLKFLDSTGVIFENGKALNGIETWNKREVRPGVLNWHPQFAEISASGNLGYTTGPWTFQPSMITDSVVARGEYATIWQLDKSGNWKFIVDLGVNDLPATDLKETIEIYATKFSTTPINLKSLLQAEEAFIGHFRKDKFEAYRQFLSAQAVLNRNRHLPATIIEDQKICITETPGEMKFTIGHSGISTSGDLGFVYGTTILNNKIDNYLRVWRREKDGWKIAMEVVRY